MEQNDGVSLTDPNHIGRFCTDFQKHRKIENHSYPPSAHLHTYLCILEDTFTYTLHTHTHPLSHTYTCMNTHPLTHTCAHTRPLTHTHVCTGRYTHMHTCPLTHTCVHTSSLTHTHVCIHALLSLACCLWTLGPPLGSLGAAVSCLHFQAPQRPRDPLPVN